MQMALQVILLLLAAGPPPADAAAPPGTCDKAGEGAPLPPTLTVGCGGSSIAGIVYAAWGTPTGACNPDGTGDATSFKANPVCHSPTEKLLEKVEKLCVGKAVCVSSSGAHGQDPYNYIRI